MSSTRSLAMRTIQHLRTQGLVATTQKAASWVRQRINGVSSATGFPDPFTDCVAVPYDPAHVVPCGAIDATRTVVQEIHLPPGEILAIEVFVATYARSNRNLTVFSLTDAAGRTLSEWRVPSRKLADNSFVRLPVADPATLAGLEAVYLEVHSPNGGCRHAITCYTTRAGQGRLWIRQGPRQKSRVPGHTGSDPSLGRPPDGDPSELGSLIYRVRFRNKNRDAFYRWPRQQPSAPNEASSPGAAPPMIGVLAGTDVPLFNSEVGAASLRHLESPVVARRALAEGGIDVLLLCQLPWSESLHDLFVAATERRVPTVFWSPAAALTPRYDEISVPSSKGEPDPGAFVESLRKTMNACDLVVTQEETVRRLALQERKRVLPLPDGSPALADIAARARVAYDRLHRPRVSIVTILYNKARELPHTLASYAAQSYEGEIEVIFVDDCSPDDSVRIVQEFKEGLVRGRVFGRSLALEVVRNERNSGNCVSRNVGLAAATGEILVVIDADCMLNRDFIKRHVEAHAFDDCEVVIGPLNIETHRMEPASVLARFERDPALVADAARLQDAVNRTSFLNCITRNFSIKREAIPAEGLFDPQFGYSADPNSGFGWEDVEAGYRLYREGARIKYVAEAISVHVTPPMASDGQKPARSMHNFARLLQKHPDIARIAPAWTRNTFQEIEAWGARAGVDMSESRAMAAPFLPVKARDYSAAPVPAPRRLRVLTFRWHVPHQYELWKLPIDVTVATGCGSPMTDHWELGQRPLPRNATFARYADIDPRRFDMAILHFDENVLAPENTNGVIGLDWGAAFRFFRENVKLPTIAVCHGTPQFHGQYIFGYDKPDLLQPIERERKRMVDYLGDVHVVCNSYQAQAEWGFRRSSVIWHGFDPAEFPPATYERGILAPLGPLVLSRPHYRGYFLYRDVFEGCRQELRPESLCVPEPHPAYTGNAYAIAKFRRYVDEIRRYSVYFNPTQRSPMPRARGEPMMCGVVPVSADNHDVSRFIEQGVDGFYSNDPVDLREQLRFLVRNPDAARRMGAAARAKAMRVFHVERYLSQWSDLIREVVR